MTCEATTAAGLLRVRRGITTDASCGASTKVTIPFRQSFDAEVEPKQLCNMHYKIWHGSTDDERLDIIKRWGWRR